ncbi:MAG: hypothetical protein K2X38_21745 [Gemmataceae bacterium]|nr:hypothetical protein [Gemmataceae bacterium]
MSDPAVEIAFRIPGPWKHPNDLIERLPPGHRLTIDGLTLPNGIEVGFGAVAADKQFPTIFRSSCRQEPTPQELAAVDGYSVNVFLMGPGGSLDAARTMMQAAAAIVQAGGAGVFIDNSALAHGGADWLDMTQEGSPDAVSFAFVAMIGGPREIYTMGMHVLGLRDVVMKRSDVEQGGFDIVEAIRYLANSERPVEEGHIIADLDGPRFRTFLEPSPAELRKGPMHNPFGRLKLVSMRDIAEKN